MIDRDLENSKVFSCRAHLHFEIPSVGFSAHAETGQSSRANCAEWAHIRITDSIQEPDERPDQPAGKKLLEIHAPGLALSTGARTDHEIVRTGDDSIDHRMP